MIEAARAGIAIKRVLITGGNRGIGAALAQVHAAHGYHVLVGARQPATAAQVVDAIRAAGGQAEVVPLDVADPASIERAAAQVEAGGSLDRLINNAGTVVVDLFERQPLDAVRAMFEVNVLGLIDLTQRLLPGMLARRTGHIVNHGSIAQVGVPTHTTYSATKAAVLALSDGLRRELRGTGVRVTCLVTPVVESAMARQVSEGAVRAGSYRLYMPPARRWLATETYAQRAFRALERAPAQYTTSQGRLFLGLHRWAPRWLFDFVMGRMFSRQ
jgi:short-subunit dehydrogenase